MKNLLDKLLNNDGLKKMQDEEQQALQLLANIKAKRQQQEQVIMLEIKNKYGEKELNEYAEQIKEKAQNMHLNYQQEKAKLVALHRQNIKVLKENYQIEKERLDIQLGTFGMKAKATTTTRKSSDFIKDNVLHFYQKGIETSFELPLPKDKAKSLHGTIKKHLENNGIESTTANSTAYRINKAYQAELIAVIES